LSFEIIHVMDQCNCNQELTCKGAKLKTDE